MSSRDEILRRVRRHEASEISPPAEFVNGIIFPDPIAQFVDVLSAVGGRSLHASSLAAAAQRVSEVASDVGAGTVCSLVEGIAASTFDVSEIDDPHLLNDVDLAVVPGQLAVAENAAVWVTPASPVERTLCFLSQNLILVVPRDEVVSNLHQAYERINVAATPFGTWISGPSKTADIEQSLVMGAHGPRSLTVILLGDD